MIDKTIPPTKLLWVDLEMTGLDPLNDVILEVAAEITDFEFQSIASYETRVVQERDIVEVRMKENVWWNDYPALCDNFMQGLEQGKSSATVEQELVQLINQHIGDEPVILAGNSIHNDRKFIKQWWPTLDARLHYRMLDVSSFKVLFQGKYKVDFPKPDVHRAFDDIHASIAELKFYLEWFKKQS